MERAKLTKDQNWQLSSLMADFDFDFFFVWNKYRIKIDLNHCLWIFVMASYIFAFEGQTKYDISATFFMHLMHFIYVHITYSITMDLGLEKTRYYYQ